LGATGDVGALFDLIRKDRYNVVLLDESVPEASGALPEKIRHVFPEVKIALFTSKPAGPALKPLDDQGSRWEVSKPCSEEDLTRLMDRLQPGRPATGSPEEAAGESSVRGKADLSRREYELYLLLKEGNNDRAIADRLQLALQTVRQHHKSLKRKLAIAGLLHTLPGPAA
jgi:DNA-binding NarL/FixJ family response regulator